MFPEGTRQTSGQLSEFKPMVAQLVLKPTPISYLFGGAFEAMPKGQALQVQENCQWSSGQSSMSNAWRTVLVRTNPHTLIRRMAKMSACC